MLNYQEYEKAVYDSFLEKREKDNNYNFSVRRKAGKGSRTDYFIGTSKSGYFGTTLWNIPVNFPGSSGDLIDIIFFYLEDWTKYGYYVEFNQTTRPYNDQNRLALELIQNLEPVIQEKIGLEKSSNPDNKMHNYRTQRRKPAYESVEGLLSDLFKDLEILIPLIDDQIQIIKEKNPLFKAHHWSNEDFKLMQERLVRRINKYKSKTENRSLEIKNEDVQNLEPTSEALNQILFGPPGTGKTYYTVNKAVSIVDNVSLQVLNDRYDTREELKERFNELIIKEWENDDKGQIAFVTFHQSMNYEQFVEGIKPGINDSKNVTYSVEPGIFKKIADKAKDNWLDSTKGNEPKASFEEAFQRLKEDWSENEEMKFSMKTKGKEFTITDFSQTSISFKKASGGTAHTLSISTLRDYYYEKRPIRQTGIGIYYPGIIEKLKTYDSSEKEKELKNYVLIIDEINRGNISEILGELITLIEENKRADQEESLEVILPYSNEPFSVPPNLYIIGTMNTADRSVEALDTALRRRFDFLEIPPHYDLDELNYEFAGSTGAEILATINKRLELLLDRDHLIGHSYFLLDENEDPEEKLLRSFYGNIIPLLQEYFYGDYAKIGAILGKGFIHSEQDVNDTPFATGFEDTTAVKEDIFQIIDYREEQPGTQYVDLNMTFEKAIQLLLNQLQEE